jgi:hypothetical protein
VIAELCIASPKRPPARAKDLAAAQRAMTDDLIQANGLLVVDGWWAWSGRMFDEAMRPAVNDARHFPCIWRNA